MIKGNCAQSVVPRYGEKFNFFWAVTVPILINFKDVVTFILGKLSPNFLKCVCFENCDGLFVQGFEEDRPKDSEKWS